MTFANIPLEEKQAALHDLGVIREQFAARGWFPGTSGNLSIRIGDFQPDRFYFAVTSRGTDKSMHTPEDFLFVDAVGEPCETTKLQPCAEAHIHSKIYRMTGCGAIVHVHTVFNNLLSELYGDNGFVPAQGIDLIKDLGIWGENAVIHIPVVPNYDDIASTAKLIPGAIRPDIPGILLRNHGIYVWGRNAFEAKRHLEVFEFIFEVEYRRLALGMK